MAGFRWGKKRGNRLLVVDMGSSSLKLVVVKTDGGRVTLEDMQMVKVPSPSPESFSLALREIIKTYPQPPQRVILALSFPDVRIRMIELPDMPDKEFMEAARWEACSKFHLEPEGVVISALSPWRGEGGGKKTLVGVVNRETLLTKVKLIEDLGLQIRGAIPTNISLVNYLVDAEGTKALLDLGDQSTRLVLAKGSKIELIRDIGIGGRDISKVVQESFNLDLPASESLKLRAKLPLKKGKIPPLESAICKLIDELAAELRLSFQYYRSKSGQEVDEVILGGGGACLGNLFGYLSQKLGLRVRLGDSWRRMEIGEDIIGEKREGVFFFPAIGVAWGEMLDTEAGRLDLFRDELNIRRRREIIEAVPRIGLVSVLLLSITGFSVLQMQVNNYGKQLENYRNVLTDLKSLSQTTRLMRQKKAALAEQFRQISQLRGKQFRWSPLLRLLGALTPQGIRWKKIEGGEDGPRVVIRLSGLSPSREGIGEFLKNLSREDRLGEITLDKVERAKSGGYEFELSGWLTGGGGRE